MAKHGLFAEREGARSASVILAGKLGGRLVD
jgi:hypothetical protein